jgi:predicted nucleotidyltransferase
MRRDEVLAILRAHREELRLLGAKSLFLFGSAARDEARADSDIDILVEFTGPATFDGFMDLKLYLEELLGRRVDLVTSKALKPRIRPNVEREAILVA